MGLIFQGALSIQRRDIFETYSCGACSMRATYAFTDAPRFRVSFVVCFLKKRELIVRYKIQGTQ